MTQARFVQGGDAIDHTPASNVASGDVVVQNDLVGIANRAIPSGTLGALAVAGVFDVAKVTGAINAGQKVYWDADADPVNGTAGSGAATTTSTANTLMGKAVADALSGDETVRVRMNQ